MNVVGHDHKSMQSIVPEDLRVVPNGLDNHVGKDWLAEVERTSASLVQETIQCGEGLSGGQRAAWEEPMRRQTVVKSPS